MYDLVLLETIRIEHLERLERAAQERLIVQIARSNGRAQTTQRRLPFTHWLTSVSAWLHPQRPVQPGLSQR